MSFIFLVRTFVSKKKIENYSTYPERILGPLGVERTIIGIRSIKTTEKLGTDLVFLTEKTMRIMFFEMGTDTYFTGLGPCTSRVSQPENKSYWTSFFIHMSACVIISLIACAVR